MHLIDSQRVVIGVPVPTDFGSNLDIVARRNVQPEGQGVNVALVIVGWIALTIVLGVLAVALEWDPKFVGKLGAILVFPCVIVFAWAGLKLGQRLFNKFWPAQETNVQPQAGMDRDH